MRPGGLLLAVYHDLNDEHREHMKSRGVDPADYVGAEDLYRLLGDDFTVELNVIEPRIDPRPTPRTSPMPYCALVVADNREPARTRKISCCLVLSSRGIARLVKVTAMEERR